MPVSSQKEMVMVIGGFEVKVGSLVRVDLGGGMSSVVEVRQIVTPRKAVVRFLPKVMLDLYLVDGGLCHMTESGCHEIIVHRAPVAMVVQ